MTYIMPSPIIEAESAIAILTDGPYAPSDVGTGKARLLYSKSPDQSVLFASTVKIMTSIILLSNADDLDDDVVIIAADLATGSGAGVLAPGDIVTLRDLLYLLMLQSNNTAGHAIARIIGGRILDAENGSGDPEARFVAEMAFKGAEIGMADSNFTNPTGGPSEGVGAFTTSRDLAVLTAQALGYPELLSIWGVPEHVVYVQGPSAREIALTNGVELIGQADDPRYHTEYPVIGGKGGTLVISPPPADRTRNLATIVSAGSAGYVVFVTMKTPPSGDRGVDHRVLIDAVMDAYYRRGASILAELYSGHNVRDVLIPCIELTCPAWPDPIRNCNGFEDHLVTLEDETEALFLASGLDVALPARNDSGQQELVFAIDGVTGEAQRRIDAALEANEEVTMIYREYVSSDLSAPASRPTRMLVVGAEFLPAGVIQVRCSYRNLLDWMWPRKRYTASFAPGLPSFR